MCRMLAYLGPAVLLRELLYEPDHSLEEQSWRPQLQQHGTVNADGWGVGWYDLSLRPEPARYRSDRPIWADRSFASVAGLVSSTCVLAAVRSATPPAPATETGSPPFTAGRWLFAHNGAVDDWHDGRGEQLRRHVSIGRASAIEGSTDSEVLFALALDELDRGRSLAEALGATVSTVLDRAEGRLNLMLTDGESVAATTWGDTLFLRQSDRDGCSAALVASEPVDGSPSWEPVPDRSLVVVTRDVPPVITPLDP